MRRFHAAVALSLALACSAGARPPAGGTHAMPDPSQSAEGPQDVVIVYGLYSPETGAGVEELEIRGKELVVRLKYTENFKAQPKTLEGPIGAGVVARLVEMFSRAMFQEMEPSLADNPHADLRVLKLSVKGVEKVVKRRGVVDEEFERLVGAVKLAAATGLPAVSQQKFFPNL